MSVAIDCTALKSRQIWDREMPVRLVLVGMKRSAVIGEKRWPLEIGDVLFFAGEKKDLQR